MERRQLLSLLLAAGFSISGGCGGPSVGAEWTLVPVEGTVMFQGAPLAGAEVAFYFEGDTQDGYLGAVGTTDESGSYKLFAGTRLGAKPGPHRVTVSKLVAPDGSLLTANASEGMDAQQLMMQGAARELMPPKVSNRNETELRVDVSKDPPPGTFDLKLN